MEARLAALLALSLGALPLAAQHDPPPAEKIIVPAQGTSVPMGDLDGRPLVDVRINGKGPFRFILDTGADTTVIGDDLKKELGLPAVEGEGVRGPDNTVMGQMVKVAELRVAEALLEGVVVVEGPISGMFRMPNAPRGVLSASAFLGYLLTLDYPGKRVLIRQGELSAPDSRSIFGYTAEQILPSALVRVAGAENRVHIDSGSPGGLTLPDRYRKELKLASEPVVVGRARTPHGEFQVWSANIDGPVELGRFKLALLDVRFADVNPIPGQVVGNIGYRILRDFQVTIDAKNRRVRFEQ
ncbi:MAG TPA: retropepsin-like aspartic protease [Bryobacteraceae bacterium]|nr:retropepsin-like aspartic protease [Bryobacteraceae bacterium]